MKRAFAILTALLLVVGWTAGAMAQAPKPGAPPGAPAQPCAPGAPGAPPAPGAKPGAEKPGSAMEVEGKIKAVTGNKVTLDDGTQLEIPATVKVNKSELKPGAMVKASYEEKGGKKIVTSLEVKGPEKGGPAMKGPGTPEKKKTY